MRLRFIFMVLICIRLSPVTVAQQPVQIYTADIHHFWDAYDKIWSTPDTSLHMQILDSLFLSKATPGLTAIRERRNYTAQEYLNAIRNYPKFWTSIRPNTLKADALGTELQHGVEALKKVYPDLRPASIYFTIGVFRTNGTTLDSMILIGSELAMADSQTDYSEFPEAEQSARSAFFKTNPLHDLVLLNVHEYVHTQQNPPVDNLLSYVIFEGVAEFVSTYAMQLPSASPAIAFGKAHAQQVRLAFEREMYYYNNYPKWLWSNADNEFGIRDLGYYIGYQMCENYMQSMDAADAIKHMINLDYTQDAQIGAFVSQSAFFSQSLDSLYSAFQDRRPFILGFEEFPSGASRVPSQTQTITAVFSVPLNGLNTGIDYGPLGASAFPKVTDRYWNADNTSWTLVVELEPNKAYQLQFSNNFRTSDGLPLKPFLLEFSTVE